jgi:uncharacterized BrkB/YihY/UPF0761 family membrane protein
MWSLLVVTFSDWYADRAQRLGAALAYYTIFALAPGLGDGGGVSGIACPLSRAGSLERQGGP